MLVLQYIYIYNFIYTYRNLQRIDIYLRNSFMQLNIQNLKKKKRKT